MKLINKRGLIFEKISIIDLLIVILAIAIIFYGYTFLTKKEVNIGNSQKIQYAFETSEVSDSFVKQLEVGKKLFNSSKNYYVGTLIDFTVKPFEVVTEDHINGIYIKREVKELYVVNMIIEANAENNIYHLRVNQEEIKIGEMFPIKGLGFASQGYIVNILEVK